MLAHRDGDAFPNNPAESQCPKNNVSNSHPSHGPRMSNEEKFDTSATKRLAARISSMDKPLTCGCCGGGGGARARERGDGPCSCR